MNFQNLETTISSLINSKQLIVINENKLKIKLNVDKYVLLKIFLLSISLFLITYFSNSEWIFYVFFLIPFSIFFFYFLGRNYEIEIDNKLNTISLKTFSYRKQVYFYSFEYFEPIEISMCFSYSDEDEQSTFLNKYYLILNCYNCSHILFEIYFLNKSYEFKEMLADIDFKYQGEQVRIINKGPVLHEKLDKIPHI